MIDDEEFAFLVVYFLVVELLAMSVLLFLLTNNIQYVIASVTLVIISFVAVEIIDKFDRRNSKN